MQDDEGSGGVLRWAAVAVPGIFAGIGWAATDGSPLLSRVLAGIAAALVVYAAIHFVVKGLRRTKR